MFYQDAKKTITAIIAKYRQPVLLLGSPGIGKSAMMKEIATDLQFDSFIDIRGTTLRPPDLRGLMYLFVKDGKKEAKFAPMSLLPRDGRHLILFDELPTCSMEVQAALYQLLLDRQLGEYKVPEDTVILAAGNRQEDKAGASRILTPLATRFITTLNLTSDLSNWLQWAIPQAIRPEIIAFLQLSQKTNTPALNNFDPKSRDNSYACERSWENASHILDCITGDTLRETLIGTIGTSAGESFSAFLAIYAEICKIPEIIAMPDVYQVPTAPDQLYSVSAALSYAADKSNLTAILTYIGRMPSEFKTLFTVDISQRHVDLTETSVYCKFAADNAATIN